MWQLTFRFISVRLDQSLFNPFSPFSKSSSFLSLFFRSSLSFGISPDDTFWLDSTVTTLQYITGSENKAICDCLTGLRAWRALVFLMAAYCCVAFLSVHLGLLLEQSASILVQHRPWHKQLVWWTETRGSTHCSTARSFFCKEKKHGNVRHYNCSASFIINEGDIFRGCVPCHGNYKDYLYASVLQNMGWYIIYIHIILMLNILPDMKL